MAVIRKHMRTVMGAELEHHEKFDGQYSSSWLASLFGVVVSVCIALIMFFGFLLFDPVFGLQIRGNFIDDRNGNTVYYEDSSHARNARSLAEELDNFGYFDDEPTDVFLKHNGDCFAISFSLIEDAWEDDEVCAYYQEMGEHLADTAFTRPLIIQLCNEDWHEEKAIRIHGKNEKEHTR